MEKNKLLFLLLFIIFLTSQISASLAPLNEINKTFLLENYGKNKEISEQYELSILVALSKYPELSNTSILFKEKSLSTTMVARPKLNFIFLPKKKHEYNIISNNKETKKGGLLLQNFSFEGQVGIIGHELGHIVDYKEKNDLQIIFTGIGYVLSKSYKIMLENKVDKITIKHGLGQELYISQFFIWNNPNISEKYKKKKEKFYYSPEEILNLTNEFESGREI